MSFYFSESIEVEFLWAILMITFEKSFNQKSISQSLSDSA